MGSGPRFLADDTGSRLSHLVRTATESDDPSELLAVSWAEFRRPMAAVDPQGMPLARAPVGAPGRQALAMAATAARGENTGPASTRWRVERLDVEGELHGYLAMETDPPLDDAEGDLLCLLRALLVDQLRRRFLRATVLRERQQAFTRRLVTEPALAAHAHDEARALGLHLAESYWPAVLVSEGAGLGERSLAGAEDLLRRYAAGSLMVRLEPQLVVLLFAGDQPEARGRDPRVTFEQLVRFVRRREPGVTVHGIAAERRAQPPELPAQVTALKRLCRYPRRELTELAVLSEESFALERLLVEGLDQARARAFVDAHLGALIAHDERHHSLLAETLEAALDYSNRDEAARVSYMHRNTFRRHLNQAIELVGVDLNDPQERLAVHVALKLRKLLEVAADGR